MILAGDARLKMGQTYTVRVHFPSQAQGVALRMLVSDLAHAVLARINADPLLAPSIVWASTDARDNRVALNIHEAMMRVKVIRDDIALRAGLLENVFRDGFTIGSGNPSYPGVEVLRCWVEGETEGSLAVSVALGAAVAFGGLYMLTTGRRGGKARRGAIEDLA